MEVTGWYLIGSRAIGAEIRLPYGIIATIREQYITSCNAGVQLLIEDLLIDVHSDDTQDTCSMFSYGSGTYNIRGHSCNTSKAGTLLGYSVSVTNPETSRCKDHPVQRDPGMRLD